MSEPSDLTERAVRRAVIARVMEQNREILDHLAEYDNSQTCASCHQPERAHTWVEMPPSPGFRSFSLRCPRPSLTGTYRPEG